MNIKKRAGVTLVEVAVSTVLVGVVLVASLETLGSAMRVTRETTSVVDASTLLGAMLAEADALPWDDPDEATQALGQEVGEPPLTTDRLAADDVDDLDGYSTSPPLFADGAAVPGYDGWTQQFRVTYASANVNAAGELPDAITDEGLRRVVCTAISPTGLAYQAERIRSRYELEGEVAPFAGQQVIGVELEIAVGTSDQVRTATATSNAPEAP